MTINRKTMLENALVSRGAPCIAALYLALICNCPARANEISIVVPNEFANVEGASGGSNLPGIGFRELTVFAGTEFDELPESHRLITALAFRPNASVTVPRTTNWGNAQLFLSTTMRDPDNLSSVFSENHGADKQAVFDGPLTLATRAEGPPEGPRRFDYSVKFHEPFFFDPTKGNLAIDFIVPSGMTPSLLDDQAVRTNSRLVDFPFSEQSTGTFTGNQLILQLTFVPEPSSVCFFVLGLTGILSIRRRHPHMP